MSKLLAVFFAIIFFTSVCQTVKGDLGDNLRQLNESLVTLKRELENLNAQLERLKYVFGKSSGASATCSMPEPKKYAENQVLSKFEKEGDLGGAGVFKGKKAVRLSNNDKIKALYASHNPTPKEYSPDYGADELEEIFLENCHNVYWIHINDCPNLERIEIKNLNVKVIESDPPTVECHVCPNLKWFCIEKSNYGVLRFVGGGDPECVIVKSCSNLTELEFTGREAFGVQTFAKCPSPKRIIVSDCEKLESVKFGTLSNTVKISESMKNKVVIAEDFKKFIEYVKD